MNTNHSTLLINIRNNISELSRAVEELEQFGTDNNIPGKIITDFALSVDEIITNIVSYGFNDNDEHIITIEVSLDDELMTAVFMDDGKPFNPLELPEPDTDLPLDERKIGGLGIYLVSRLMDSLEYNYISGKNVLKITKKMV